MAENLQVYYYSDPDGATKDQRCHEIFTAVPFATLPWHVHKDKPDDTLKDPVWDNKTGAWRENDANAQGQLLAQAQEKIDALDKGKQDLDTALDQVKAAQAQAAQQSELLTKQNGQVMQTLMAMQQTMAAISKSLTPAKTDNAQNGGKN